MQTIKPYYTDDDVAELAILRQLLKTIDRSNKIVFDTWYDLYLRTAYWKNKKKSIIRRSGGMCERCKFNDMVDVHHITYDNLAWEKLKDLIGLCRTCHKRLHKIPFDKIHGCIDSKDMVEDFMVYKLKLDVEYNIYDTGINQ